MCSTKYRFIKVQKDNFNGEKGRWERTVSSKLCYFRQEFYLLNDILR